MQTRFLFRLIRNLGLGALLLACNPSEPNFEGETASTSKGQSNSSKQVASDLKEHEPDLPVSLNVQGMGATYSLNASLGTVEFSVRSCASGYVRYGLTLSESQIMLYRFDQGCKIHIDRFDWNGETFSPLPGQPFDAQLGASNTFISGTGRYLFLKVLEQLPAILNGTGHQARFVISENSRGLDMNIEVYEIGVEVDRTELVESQTELATFKVRRALPANGSLTVFLNLGGTVDLLSDLTPLNSSLVLASGEAEKLITVRALRDGLYDDLETLNIAIAPGAYLIKGPAATLNIRDQSYRPPSWTQTHTTRTLLDDDALSLTFAAIDPDDDPVTYSLDASRTTCGLGWSPQPSMSAAGVVSGIPRDAAIGSCVISVRATSLGGTITQDLAITVQNRPEPPVWIQTLAAITLFGGETLQVDFVANDPDPDAAVSYSLDPSASCMGLPWSSPLSINSQGRLSGIPSTTLVGTCIVRVRAQSQGDTISWDLNVNVAKRTLAWSAPLQIASNVCAPVSVRLENGLGSALPANGTVTLNLVVNNGTASYFSGATCGSTQVISTLNISTGGSQANFFVRSTSSAQNLTLVASASGYEPGTALVNVGATPTRYLVSGPSTAVLGRCLHYRVDQVDSSGIKVANNSNRSVTLSATADLQLYRDESCLETWTNPGSINAFQTGFDVYVRPTGTGTESITASGGGLTTNTFNVSVVTQRSWWNSSWAYRKPIMLDNLDQATAHTNQPVLVRLNPSRIDYALVKPDGSDLRFVNSADNQVLAHQIEQWNPNGTSLVWVRVDSIPASSAQGFFYMYFGNPFASSAENASNLWTAYAGVWHLGESPTTSAPQFRDSTVAARHGTAVSGPLSFPGPVGNGVSLMGFRDYIELVGQNLATQLGATATLSVWIKTTQTGSTIGWQSPAITGVEANGTTNDIQYGWINNTGLIGITAGDSGVARSNFVVNDNAWRHVTITRNQSTGQVTFYVNGVANGSGTSESGAKTTVFNKFGILWDTSGAHKDLNGYLDEIRIASSVLSAAKIRADYKYMLDAYVSILGAEGYLD